MATSTINISWSNPLYENREQPLENQERNKSVYPDSALDIQDVCIALYSSQYNEHSEKQFKHSAPFNTFS